MKARYLKALLGTNRPTADYGEYIAVGSGYVHDLLSVNKKTLRMRYALTFPENSDPRKYLENQHREGDDMLGIWDKIAELVKSGEIRDIIEGVDDIPEDKRVPIFLVDEYKVIETHGDALGWPNTTYDGRMLYNNTGYAERDKAVAYAIANAEAGIKTANDLIRQWEDKIASIRQDLAQAEASLMLLQNP